MGKFSGILICSDFDGTLARHAQVPEINFEAIKYFQENGGMFTVISGRTAEFFSRFDGRLKCDRYIGCINGTVIYDIENKSSEEEHFMSRPEDVVSFILGHPDFMQKLGDIVVFNNVQTETVCLSSPDFEHDFRRAMSQERVYKILCHSNEAFPAENVAWVREALGDGFTVSQSWAHGIEVQDSSFDKGHAAKRIAQLLGARTLICAGDYENDLPLLRVADVAYAAGSHHPALEGVADKITPPCEEGMIAYIIDELDKKYI